MGRRDVAYGAALGQKMVAVLLVEVLGQGILILRLRLYKVLDTQRQLEYLPILQVRCQGPITHRALLAQNLEREMILI